MEQWPGQHFHCQTLTNNSDDSNNNLAEPTFLRMHNDSKPASLVSILNELQRTMSDEREKLKIDQEDLLNDVVVYYKDSHFDPKKKLWIIHTLSSGSSGSFQLFKLVDI